MIITTLNMQPGICCPYFSQNSLSNYQTANKRINFILRRLTELYICTKFCEKFFWGSNSKELKQFVIAGQRDRYTDGQLWGKLNHPQKECACVVVGGDITSVVIEAANDNLL